MELEICGGWVSTVIVIGCYLSIGFMSDVE